MHYYIKRLCIWANFVVITKQARDPKTHTKFKKERVQGGVGGFERRARRRVACALAGVRGDGRARRRSARADSCVYASRETYSPKL
jgi:hypothetical protein